MPNGKLNGFRSTPIHNRINVLKKRIQSQFPSTKIGVSDILAIAAEEMLRKLEGLSVEDVVKTVREAQDKPIKKPGIKASRQPEAQSKISQEPQDDKSAASGE